MTGEPDQQTHPEPPCGERSESLSLGGDLGFGLIAEPGRAEGELKLKPATPPTVKT